MAILDIFSQAHNMLFQYVILNTFIFYFMEDFSTCFSFSLWVSSVVPIIHMLDFLCVSSIFVIFSWPLFYFPSFIFECCCFFTILKPLHVVFICLFLSFSYNSLHFFKKNWFFPFIDNSSLSSVTLFLSFSNSDLCYFSL